jgi:putative sterol carrier protein
MELDIQSIMEKVVQSFQPDKAAGVDAKVQFHLTGSQSADYVATIRDQKLSIEPGTIENPSLLFRADSKDVLDVFTGKVNPMQAYMQGKIHFKGDMGLAMRLAGMFRKPQ